MGLCIKWVPWSSTDPKKLFCTGRSIKIHKICVKISCINIYRTRAIITRGLHPLYPIFEGQKSFLRSFFRKFLTLCMVSIQERVIMARVR